MFLELSGGRLNSSRSSLIPSTMTIHPLGQQTSRQSFHVSGRGCSAAVAGGAGVCISRRSRCRGRSGPSAEKASSPRSAIGRASTATSLCRPKTSLTKPRVAPPETTRTQSEPPGRANAELSLYEEKRVRWSVGQESTRRVLACVAASPPCRRLACPAPAGSIRAWERPAEQSGHEDRCGAGRRFGDPHRCPR